MKVDVALDAPAYLVSGDDPVLLEDAVVALVEQLVGDEDRTLVVDELGIERYEVDGAAHPGAVVDAARTPPFLTSRRVVVARHAAALAAAESIAALVGYLDDPSDTTALVLVWERSPKPGASARATPKKLLDALKRAGGVVVAAGPGKQKPAQWLDEQLREAPVHLDAAARKLIVERVGEDAGRVVGLVPVLCAVFGEGAKLGVDDVAPYLGDEGGAKPWNLTDAIDAGDVALALDRLHRMLGADQLAGVQVLALLHNHVQRMLALDGLDIADEKAAAAALGMTGSTFPARKALQQGRLLGHDRLVEFIRLLARADLDLRGARTYPAEVRDALVLEIAVARLASRTPRRGGRRTDARTGRSSRR